MGNCCCIARVADDVSDGHISVLSSAFSKSSLAKVSAAKSAGASSFTGAVKLTPSAVKVAVVVRPLLDFEQQKGAASGVVLQPPDRVSLPARPAASSANDAALDFQFDRVYNGATPPSCQSMYSDMVQQVLERYCHGFNGTVLAYGQTGSGKTFQMGTAAGLRDISGKAAAVIPRACCQVLDYIAAAKQQYDVTLKASFVEIYNESIQDLLATSSSSSAAAICASAGGSNLLGPRYSSGNTGSRPTTPRAGGSETAAAAAAAAGEGVSIRETAKGEIVLEGVLELTIASKQDVVQLLEMGKSARATAAHRMNQSSSRSHAILTLSMEQRAKPAAAQQLPSELRFLKSKLHLVDLAGSERAKETGTTGQRFAEGVAINKGLLELGNVINALTEGTSRKHIPYRNSKLTRLLQDSLGGNSETLFIACISPADTNRDHTISTLRYASRAMKIKNSLKRNNQLSPEEEIAYLRQLVSELTEENNRLKGKSAAAAAVGAAGAW